MIRTDLHVHTNYCDGKNTPEEMVLSAISARLECIGFSGHSYTSFDESYCMSKSGTVSYLKEIAYLKEKYKDKIRILCGIEQDYFSEENTDCYDYVIGSVHYVKVNDTYVSVDESPDAQKHAIAAYFNGDPLAFAENYFSIVSDVARKTNADIIGHFDLLTKFCEKEEIFDQSHPRYITAWKSAVDTLLPYGKVFEINTGAISRGYRSTPYPSPSILEYIRQHGGRFILSGDSHSKDTLCYKFSEFEKLL